MFETSINLNMNCIDNLALFENVDQPQHELHWQSCHVWKRRTTSTWTTLTISPCLKTSNHLNMNYIDNLAMFVNVGQPQHELHWQSRHVWKRLSTSTWTTLTISLCLKTSINLNMNFIDNIAMFENVDQPQHELHLQSCHVWKRPSTSTWTTLTISPCLKTSNHLNMNYIDNLAMFENVHQPQHELHWQSRHVWKRQSISTWTTLTFSPCLKTSINLNINYIDNLAMFENIDQPQHELHWQCRHVWKRRTTSTWTTLTISPCL